MTGLPFSRKHWLTYSARSPGVALSETTSCSSPVSKEAECLAKASPWCTFARAASIIEQFDHRQISVNSMPTSTTADFVDGLASIVGRQGLLTSLSDLLVYECDGYTIEKNKPDVVVFPTSTEQVAQVVKLCGEYRVPFLPRGAGTSLAGGCLPVGG